MTPRKQTGIETWAARRAEARSPASKAIRAFNASMSQFWRRIETDLQPIAACDDTPVITEVRNG